jgi:hypothetical protein
MVQRTEGVSTMAQAFISMSTIELKKHGGEKALAELHRRADNGSRYAGKALEELGATVNVNGKPAKESAPAPDNAQLDAIMALLGQMGIDTSGLEKKAKSSPAPVKPKSKKKGKASETITGANIQRTRDDNGWTWECLGVWDGDKVGTDHKITGHKAQGNTNDEAKNAFYAPFKEAGVYLARPYYNDVIDNRANPLTDAISKATGYEALAPAEMTREQLKSALGLPESCSKRTSTLVDMLAKQNFAHEDVTDVTEQVQRGIANLLEKFGQ